MSELDLLDDVEKAAEDGELDDASEGEITFADNGKPANYFFCVADLPELGVGVYVVPIEYWDAEKSPADWDLKLEVAGFTQEAEGVYSYDKSDTVKPEALPEVLHRKFEKAGVVFSAELAALLNDGGMGFDVYKP